MDCRDEEENQDHQEEAIELVQVRENGGLYGVIVVEMDKRYRAVSCVANLKNNCRWVGYWKGKERGR